MKKISILLIVFLFALSGCAPRKEQVQESEEITIFATNDMHGNLSFDEQKGVIGIEQVAAIKASVPNSVLVDAGDSTQGASFATLSQGQDVVSMMNEAGYDLMAAGNHDFDFGADALLENARLADFPILSANVKRAGKPLLESSVILKRAGYRIGFIGLTTKETATSTNPTFLQGVTFEDEISAAKKEIDAISGSADAIVLVCHLGDNEKAVSCTSEKLVKSLSEGQREKIAAIIDGHSHTIEEKRTENIPIVQADVNFSHLCKVTISFRGETFTSSGEVLDFSEARNFPLTDEGREKGEKVLESLSAISQAQQEILDEFLGVLAHPLFGGYVCRDFAESRIVETAYGDFVTDAFCFFSKEFQAQNARYQDFPVIAVENGGGISQSLPTWHNNGTDVTVGDILNAFNHGNVVEVLLVSPSDLFAALEGGISATGQDETGLLLRERVSGSFLQAGGFSYTYDPSLKTGEKVTEVKLFSGEILDRDDKQNRLLLATNNYVSTFFENAQKVGELGGEDQLIMEYFGIRSDDRNGILTYDCKYDRIFIANDRSPETYEVKLKVTCGGEPYKNQTFQLWIDGIGTQDDGIGSTPSGFPVTTDEEGYFTVTLSKGAHYLQLLHVESFVYVNNYSGTGTVYTTEGYYKFEFSIPYDVAEDQSA